MGVEGAKGDMLVHRRWPNTPVRDGWKAACGAVFRTITSTLPFAE